MTVDQDTSIDPRVERGELPGRFRSRPVEVEAIQLKWATWSALCDWLASHRHAFFGAAREIPWSSVSDTCGEDGPLFIEVDIETPEGVMTARHGDWIIRGTIGEFYPCKPDVFAVKYEQVG